MGVPAFGVVKTFADWEYFSTWGLGPYDDGFYSHMLLRTVFLDPFPVHITRPPCPFSTAQNRTCSSTIPREQGGV
jgi:hypothetical protein